MKFKLLTQPLAILVLQGAEMLRMYTMQKYLQYDTLKHIDIFYFDSWASTFGEMVTAIELTSEGAGYRAKTQFAKADQQKGWFE